MHYTIVGPTHPYKGGVAQHTTTLAHRLAEAGCDVDLVSWSAQYPSALYPGVQRVSTPEVPEFPGARYPLAWYRPDSWWRLGRSLRARKNATLLLVLVSPIQIPAYLGILAGMRWGRRKRDLPRVGVIGHNVVAHEPRPGDRMLTRALLRRSDFVVAHSEQEGSLARSFGVRDVRTTELPPHGPGATAAAIQNRGGAGLLFFGFIRPYKGVDVLLRAVAEVPGVRLLVAGESWNGEDSLRSLVKELGIADRVDLRLSYLPAEELEDLLRDADAMVIPYTSGTGTQMVRVAQAHGVPVIATRISTVPEQVDEGVDGFLVRPGDVQDLASAIRRLYEPGTLAALRSAVRPPDLDLAWGQYVDVLTRGTESESSPRDAVS